MSRGLCFVVVRAIERSQLLLLLSRSSLHLFSSNYTSLVEGPQYALIA